MSYEEFSEYPFPDNWFYPLYDNPILRNFKF